MLGLLALQLLLEGLGLLLVALAFSFFRGLGSLTDLLALSALLGSAGRDGILVALFARLALAYILLGFLAGLGIALRVFRFRLLLFAAAFVAPSLPFALALGESPRTGPKHDRQHTCYDSRQLHFGSPEK
jgi:hypothetical protein